MSGLRVGEICAGYNGLGMAVERVFKARTAWFSEYGTAPSKILAHNYPDTPNHGDVTKIDWARVEPVEIVSAGTPCQDLSTAGRLAGMTEGTRSNLWVQVREAIAIQKPTYVVWENVRGALSAKANSDLEHCPRCMGEAGPGGAMRALGRVLGDLSDLGFDAEWRGLRAAEVGACHARFRIFVLAAHRDRLGSHRRWAFSEQARREESQDRSHSPAHANGWDGARRLANAQREAVERTPPAWDSETNWGEYAAAIRRWEPVVGRPAPRPTEPTGRDGGERLSPRFTEWMMGLPDGWVTDPAIGLTRSEQLKACGNGVVPQQAIAALSDMLAAFEQMEVAA